ncbi:hypothetical protein P7C73_g24, partial [Tremellales sp. Uapishka_1]
MTTTLSKITFDDLASAWKRGLLSSDGSILKYSVDHSVEPYPKYLVNRDTITFKSLKPLKGEKAEREIPEDFQTALVDRLREMAVGRITEAHNLSEYLVPEACQYLLDHYPPTNTKKTDSEGRSFITATLPRGGTRDIHLRFPADTAK